MTKTRWIGWLPVVCAVLLTAACGDARERHHAALHDRHYRPGDGAIDVRDGEVVVRAGGTADDAHVGADGSLRLGTRTVELSPAGAEVLRRYSAEAIAVEQHGKALGRAGAQFGWRTVKDVLRSLFHGEAEDAGRRAEDGARALEASADELCARFGSLYRAQQEAAQAIPEFRPYAVISQRQVDDCREHGSARPDDDAPPPAAGERDGEGTRGAT